VDVSAVFLGWVTGGTESLVGKALNLTFGAFDKTYMAASLLQF